jgi:hypothetical protein
LNAIAELSHCTIDAFDDTLDRDHGDGHGYHNLENNQDHETSRDFTEALTRRVYALQEAKCPKEFTATTAPRERPSSAKLKESNPLWRAFLSPACHQGSEPHTQFNGYESALEAKEKNQKQQHAC